MAENANRGNTGRDRNMARSVVIADKKQALLEKSLELFDA